MSLLDRDLQPKSWTASIRLAAVLLALSAVGLTTSCAGSHVAALGEAVFSARNMLIASPSWLDDGYVYFPASPPAIDNAARPDEIWRVKPGEPAERVDTRWPAPMDCIWPQYGNFDRLPDGRLGLVRWCKNPDGPPIGASIVAIDAATGRQQVVVSYPNGHPTPNMFAFNPGLKTGVIADNELSCGAMMPTTDHSAGRFAGPVTLSGRTWSLEDGYATLTTTSCDKYGRVAGPKLTPQGLLVFVASPTSQGLSGDPRINQPWNLYSWDMKGQPTTIATGFGNLTGMALSRDGTRVLITARHAGHVGLWLVDVGSGRARLVGASAHLADPTFSPDGNTAITVWEPGDPFTTGQLRMFTLHDDAG